MGRLHLLAEVGDDPQRRERRANGSSRSLTLTIRAIGTGCVPQGGPADVASGFGRHSLSVTHTVRWFINCEDDVGNPQRRRQPCGVGEIVRSGCHAGHLPQRPVALAEVYHGLQC